MNTATKIAFLVIFTMVAFAGLCASQTLPRDSVGHYLCWIAAFGALGGAALITTKFDNKAE